MDKRGIYKDEDEDDVKLDFNLIKYINKLPYTQEYLLDARRLKNLSIAWPMGGGGNGSSSSSSSLSDDSAIAGLYTVGTTGSGADYIATGLNEDDLAIQEAFDACSLAGGGIVFQLPGEYIQSDLLQLPSNVKYTGSGIDVTINKAVAAYNPSTSAYGTAGRRVMMKSYNDAAIENNVVSGITWDANVQNIPGLTSNSFHRTVWLQNTTNLTIEKCKVINGINWSIYVNLSSKVWIKNNTVLGGYSSTYDQNDGIHIRNSSGWFIQDNYIDTLVGGGTSGDDAIAFVQGSEATQDMRGGVITGNVINGAGSRGIICTFDSAYHVRDILISNNTISNVEQAGIKLYTQSSVTGEYKGIKISDNTLYNIGTLGTDLAHGISLDKSYSGARQLFNDVSITGNVIRNMVYTSGWGIIVQEQASDIVVSNNTITGVSGLGGIKIGDSGRTVTGFVCNGNKVNIFNAASNAVGIYLYTATKGTCNGNQLFGHITGTTYGIYLNASTGISFTGNHIDTFDYVIGSLAFTRVESFTGNTVENINNASIISNIGGVFNNYGINPIASLGLGNKTGALTISRTDGDHQTFTATGNITLTLPAAICEGDRLTIQIIQDGTGGRTMTWPSNFKKAGGTLTLTTTAAAADVVDMVYSNTNWWEVSRALNSS